MNARRELPLVAEMVEGVLDARSPQSASMGFFTSARRFGATYIQTRLYRRPAVRLTSQSHWDAGGFVLRVAPQGWAGSGAFNYICFDCNPLLEAIRENRTRYRFSDFAPHEDRAFGDYWDALAEADIGEALCATSYGAGGRIASLHLGFGERNIPPREARAMQMAGLLLTERLMEFSGGPKTGLPKPGLPELTARERDCLAWVAEGKRDRTIAAMLGISEATVRFHIDNARHKLGAASRAQAVARMANLRLL